MEACKDPPKASPYPKVTHKPSPSDFMFGSTLGEGAYARVVHARMKSSGDEFAVKIMEKRFIKKENKVKFVMMERKVFSIVSHPNIVKLYFTFQDRDYLYMVMDLCRGGELLDVITTCAKPHRDRGELDKACSMEITRFYIAQVVRGLEYLHSMHIIHRDLKPENILLKSDGHIKITDFGTSKIEEEGEKGDSGSRHNTFCGTAEYVSPEVLRDQDASRGCDLWALGCMVFQMMVGRPLFRGENEYLTFQMILNHPDKDFAYPVSFPSEARDLCDRLLLQEAGERLGSGPKGSDNDYEALKSHPFFDSVEWEALGSMQAPYTPSKSSLPPTENDGSVEDWLFAGVATELQGPVICPQEIIQEGSARVSEGTERKSRSNSIWRRFLQEDEDILFTSLISKRVGLFSRKRQLILTSKPRLIYVDPSRMKQKGEIPWSSSLYVHVKNATTFDVVTMNRVYHLTDQLNGSGKWADKINEALEHYKR